MPRAATSLATRLATSLACPLLFLTGCFSTPENLIQENPALRIAVARDAALAKDFTKVPGLIDELTAPDPAVRFYASRALTDIAGDDFGFIYYIDPDRQGPALDRWQQWMNSLGPATQPTALATSNNRK